MSNRAQRRAAGQRGPLKPAKKRARAHEPQSVVPMPCPTDWRVSTDVRSSGQGAVIVEIRKVTGLERLFLPAAQADQVAKELAGAVAVMRGEKIDVVEVETERPSGLIVAGQG